jgi:light-harvesting protein B-800-850 alpha chain
MNQGKIWRVVKPTVGVPIFLGAVAISSFTVHYMLLTHTTWLPAYYNGKAAKVATVEAPSTTAAAAPTALVAAATAAPKQ